PLIIGRGDGCEVRIEHHVLSRRHARLVPGPRLTIQDLGSTNGTRINGVLCKGGEPVELAASEAFSIGPFSFVVAARTTPDARSLTGREALRVNDPSLRGVPPLIHEIARSSVSVVLLGETGVGKEVL